MYVTVFRNFKRPGMDADAYAADAARMETLAAREPGFRSIKTFHADDGEVVTITEWDSEETAKAWGRHPDHAVVQARGRAEYYESNALFSVSDPEIRRYAKGEQ